MPQNNIECQVLVTRQKRGVVLGIEKDEVHVMENMNWLPKVPGPTMRIEIPRKLTLNTGNYESRHLGVTLAADCDPAKYQECYLWLSRQAEAIIGYEMLRAREMPIPDAVRNAVPWLAGKGA